MSGAVPLVFDRGTLVIDAPSERLDLPALTAIGFVVDERSGGRLRAPAAAYRRALTLLMRAGLEVDDRARGYEELDLIPRRRREPFPHQSEALAAWQRGGRRGVVVLPTGAGKSYVAELAIAEVQRSTLIVAPTIDLMNQWMALLGAAFGAERVGAVGGGTYEVRPLTATTYDSAYIHMEHLGARFGLIVFDECHHLPGASYALGAESAIAPYRLGLTATPERQDGGHARLDSLIGPTVYRREIQELTGDYLADYEVVRIRVELTPQERQAYDAARAEYRAFVQQNGIRMSRPDGWGQFLMLTCRSAWGRSAWRAWREQRRIPLQCNGKLAILEDLLVQHHEEQVIIFTADNETVYRIAQRYLLPAITHQTPARERQEILAALQGGTIRAVVTSRVLNEGVDIPTASVGVVMSGSSSVREHVQRLGRILRKGEGKEAVLYEVVTAETGEEYSSERRREHGAYR
ncbi:MAG: helicase [Deltaproteobacteria bacterium HGW-Deltaproteobacteria-14]|jgi:superfamily II DNA or RNA helicase|nr:MAG: helicase [Deltaproteobacteria bacterium HGW-Deltaproteobacteria-14]